MKNCTLLIFLAFSINAYSQNSQITFEKKNNKIQIIGDTALLTLPFTFRFKENDFKKIELKNPINKISLSGEQAFGVNSGIKTKTVEGFYEIQLKFLENKVQASIKNDDEFVACPDNSIQVSLDGEQVTIRYKKGTEYDANDYVSGYIYYDAMALVSNKLDKRTKLEILISYGYKESSENPFLKSIYDLNQSSEQVLLSPTALLTNLGNTDVTNFAAGLARFLAERTKEELNEAFFSKMKEQLNAYPELKTVFPKTSSFLNIIETYSYAAVIQVLKEAFETDIQNLPANLYEVKNLNPSKCSYITKDKLKTSCEERMTKLKTFFESQDGRWVGLGMFTVKESITTTNPSNLLKSVVESDELKGVKDSSKTNLKYDDYNIVASIELSNLISQSLVSTDEKQVYINTSQLSSLFKTKDAFKVYLGLLLAHEQMSHSKIAFYMSDDSLRTFEKILIDEYSKYQEFESLVKNVHSAFNSANNAVKKMIAATDKLVESDPQALYNYYSTFTSSLKPIAHSPLLKTITGKDIGAEYDKVEQFLNPAVDIAYHISTKKYSAAIYDASILLSALNELKETTTDKNGKTKEEKYNGFKPITKSFLKYGTLISTVANAQSSDEVKNAIEASVLPVGSSSIKRNSNWSISINAYVGGYWSYQSNQNQIPIMGLSAPIGVNFSKGGLNKWFNGFSSSGNWGGLSANIQIIDLGALVNYYLLKGDTASIPNDFTVRLSNIFAPGFNLCYNIPKTPLSIAWGGQYIPTLYKYEQINGTNQLTPTNAFRMQFSLLVDIPMYNLKVWDFKK